MGTFNMNLNLIDPVETRLSQLMASQAYPVSDSSYPRSIAFHFIPVLQRRTFSHSVPKWPCFCDGCGLHWGSSEDAVYTAVLVRDAVLHCVHNCPVLHCVHDCAV
jgi:hypothetical protein